MVARHSPGLCTAHSIVGSERKETTPPSFVPCSMQAHLCPTATLWKLPMKSSKSSTATPTPLDVRSKIKGKPGSVSRAFSLSSDSIKSKANPRLLKTLEEKWGELPLQLKQRKALQHETLRPQTL